MFNPTESRPHSPHWESLGRIGVPTVTVPVRRGLRFRERWGGVRHVLESLGKDGDVWSPEDVWTPTPTTESTLQRSVVQQSCVTSHHPVQTTRRKGLWRLQTSSITGPDGPPSSLCPSRPRLWVSHPKDETWVRERGVGVLFPSTVTSHIGRAG